MMTARHIPSLNSLLLLTAPILQAVAAQSNQFHLWEDAASVLSRRETGNDPSHGPVLPPLDLHRSTSNSILLAQICGIVGAYFFTITVIGICLLTFGRRLRREAQYGFGRAPEVEMIKTPGRLHDPPPMSPASTTRSFKNFFGKGSRKNSSQVDSIHGSVHLEPGHASFDAKVMQDNKDRAQRDMEMLYQAVMEQEAASTIGVAKSKQDIQVTQQPIYGELASPRSPYSQHDAMSFRRPSDAAQSTDMRAGFRDGRISASDRFSPRSPLSPGLPASPRSTHISNASGDISASRKKAGRWNKNLRINAGNAAQFHGDEERTPLSATFAAPPGYGQPITPYTAKSDATHFTVATEYSDDGYENLDQPQPLPRPAPQRGLSHPDNLHAARSAASSTSTLPLRSLNSVGQSDIPPTPVKTTYLDVRNKGLQRNPKTAGLTPMTGVPATPYSPYMPYTPITPVTPHLVTRKERKNMAKESRRRHLIEDDGGLVSSTAETFGSAY